MQYSRTAQESAGVIKLWNEWLLMSHFDVSSLPPWVYHIEKKGVTYCKPAHPVDFAVN
jgi:hypothetical protein